MAASFAQALERPSASQWEEKKRVIQAQLDELTGLADSDLDLVQVDGLVVLKVIKHCKENLPEQVSGPLLGMDIGPVLEVTNCFPFPTVVATQTPTEGEPEEDTSTEYQLDMMRCLRDVNVDNNTVGWYQSTYLGSFLNDSVINTQFQYQSVIPKCVMLIYDPYRTKRGALSLRAYRLTKAFMELFKNGRFTQDALTAAGVTYNEIIEEIPVRIRNSPLANAMLAQLEAEGAIGQSLDFERLNLSSGPFLEKNLEFLIDLVDDLSSEQNRLQFYQRSVLRQEAQKAMYQQRRKQERRAAGDDAAQDEDLNAMFKPLAEPSRLEALLKTKQMSNYCAQVNQFAGISLSKLYAVRAVQTPNAAAAQL